MSSITSKITLVVAAVLVTFIIIIARLLYLQMYCQAYFAERSTKNFIRYETHHTPRGDIYDIHGHLLATNKPITSLMWQGTGNKGLNAFQKSALEELTAIVEKDFLSGQLYEKIVYAERRNQKVVLESPLDFSALSKIAEKFSQHSNIVIDTTFKRFYPYNHYASHVIGYVGSIRVFTQGQSGLEKQFDVDLSGKSTEMCHVVNSAGRRLSQKEIEKGSSGSDLYTTIDIMLQQLCEKSFPDYYTGSFILFNPVYGAIKALVSRPSYD